jgi:hypothetical protein
MTMTHDFPPLDFEHSRYTGWTRAHWTALLARLTAGYARAAARSGSPARALYPDDRRGLPDATDAVESFARMASAWGAWLSNPANPAELMFDGQSYNLEALLRQALLDGTDPANAQAYWGDMTHMDQRLVESGDIAVALWLSRARVFDRLSAAEQARILAWLGQVDGQGTYYDNWVLFSALAQTVRLRLGAAVLQPAAVPLAELDANLDTASAFYRGDGWYVDGAGDEFELYNAWMFNWHFLHWAAIDGERRPELRALVLSRAAAFLASFPYFFGANGAYVAWGRSLVYRFAAVAGFATGYALRVAPGGPGLLRRISSGCIRYFYERGLFDPDEHFVRQGFHGNFPPAGEAYISPGSVYWCCHGLFALSFAADDPWWTAPEAPLPVERGDFDLALPAPGFAVSGRRATGQVLLLNSRSGQQHDAPGHNYTSKYGKLVYSSHLPFNVLPSGTRRPYTFAPDAMLALTRDGQHFGHRLHTRRGGVAPGLMWCCFDEYVDDELQAVWAAVLLAGDRQIRLAVIRPSFPVRAYEAPGALGCQQAAGIQRRSDPAAGWEYAEAAAGGSADTAAVAIRRLLGYDGQLASRPFLGHSNINLAYEYAEQPLIFETHASVARRCLASVSLVRPAPFDPAAELAGIAVSALPGDAFQVTLPEARAFVAVGDQLPPAITVDAVVFSGPGIRYAQVGAGQAGVSAVGVLEAAGVFGCEAPASVSLTRAEGAVTGTTDAGLTLAEAWLGGPARATLLRGPEGDWHDVSERCAGGHLPGDLVREWAERHQRTLVEFRMER